MSTTTGRRDLVWMAVGTALLVALVLVILRANGSQNAAAQLVSKANRIQLVEEIRLALASASEAEKSAVMAATDQESHEDADQARAATALAEAKRRELGPMLDAGSDRRETDLFAQFSQAFADFRRIDQDLLALAVKNTNIKAYGMAFGPAADAVDEMSDALSRIAARSAASAGSNDVATLALHAETETLRLQALLAPHIAQANDARMDELEATMDQHAKRARKDLDGLAAVTKLQGDPDLHVAVAAFDRFILLKTQIVALSRENTNVRSVTISLTEKRRASVLCQDALMALDQAIAREPVAGVQHWRPASPR
jgi:hypothetical protein